MNRMDALYAIVYDHTLAIDKYSTNTIDRAEFGGHFYYSQAMGSIPLGAAILATYKFLSGDLHPDPYKPLPLYLITLILAAVPSALTAVLLFRWLGEFSGGIFDRLAVTLSYSLSTLVLPYSTLYYNYMLALFLCLCAFLLVEEGFRRKYISTPRLAGAGFLLSYAFITQFDTAIIGLCVIGYMAIGMKNKTRLIYTVLGAVPPLLMMAAWNNACFGSPFTIGLRHIYESAYPEYNELARRGWLGFSSFNPRTLFNLIFQPGRGLMWLSPFLVFSIPGFAVFFTRKETRLRAVLFMSVIIMYLFYNASIVVYHGGAAAGPRYLTPALFFMCAPALFALQGRRIIWKLTYSALAASAALCLALVTLAGPHIPPNIQSPFFSIALPMTLSDPPVWASTNLGYLLGLRGFASLIPLCVFAAVCMGLLIVFSKRAGAIKRLGGPASKGTGLPAGDNISTLTPQARFRALEALPPLLIVAVFFGAGFLLSDTHSATAAMTRGDILFMHKLYARAGREYTYALEKAGGGNAARYGRALAENMNGDTEAAIKDLLAILRNAPDDIYARDLYAQILKLKKKDISGAAAQYAILLKSKQAPRKMKFEARMTLGLDFQMKERHTQALEQFGAAAKMIPEQTEPFVLSANSLIALYNSGHDKSRLVQAAAFLRSAIRRAPDSIHPHETLAAIDMRLGNFKEAARIAREIYALDPANKQAAAITKQISTLMQLDEKRETKTNE